MEICSIKLFDESTKSDEALIIKSARIPSERRKALSKPNRDNRARKLNGKLYFFDGNYDALVEYDEKKDRSKLCVSDDALPILVYEHARMHENTQVTSKGSRPIAWKYNGIGVADVERVRKYCMTCNPSIQVTRPFTIDSTVIRRMQYNIDSIKQNYGLALPMSSVPSCPDLPLQMQIMDESQDQNALSTIETLGSEIVHFRKDSPMINGMTTNASDTGGQTRSKKRRHSSDGSDVGAHADTKSSHDSLTQSHVPPNTPEGALESLAQGKWLSSTAIDSVLRAICTNNCKILDPQFISVGAYKTLSLRAKERIFVVPIFHLNHWTVCIVDLDKEQTRHFDSIEDESRRKEARDAIGRVESKDAGGRITCWSTLSFKPTPGAMQDDGISCGDAVIFNALLCVADMPPRHLKVDGILRPTLASLISEDHLLRHSADPGLERLIAIFDSPTRAERSAFSQMGILVDQGDILKQQIRILETVVDAFCRILKSRQENVDAALEPFKDLTGISMTETDQILQHIRGLKRLSDGVRRAQKMAEGNLTSLKASTTKVQEILGYAENRLRTLKNSLSEPGQHAKERHVSQSSNNICTEAIGKENELVVNRLMDLMRSQLKQVHERKEGRTKTHREHNLVTGLRILESRKRTKIGTVKDKDCVSSQEADVLYMTKEQLNDWIEADAPLTKPVVVVNGLSLGQTDYMKKFHQIQKEFGKSGREIDVQDVDRPLRVRAVRKRSYEDVFADQTADTSGLNILNLWDSLHVTPPDFLLKWRFQLAKHLTSGLHGTPGKQEFRPCDIQSSAGFLLYAHQLSVSSMHFDVWAGTWIAPLHDEAEKVWPFITNPTEVEKEAFIEQGNDWVPEEGRVSTVVLKKGDVLIMWPGIYCAHAPITASKRALLAGGSFLDANSLLSTLDKFLFICRHPTVTNEDIPREALLLLNQLPEYIQNWPERLPNLQTEELVKLIADIKQAIACQAASKKGKKLPPKKKLRTKSGLEP